ncbi:uncharacterized protein DS421_2g58530 [Arachis hypogaea]|nr:uncharacterized protein DS421_2g58530 [Arachis hypogaea]
MTEEQKEVRYVCFKTLDKVYGIHVCEENNEKQKQLTCKEMDLIPKPSLLYGKIVSDYVKIKGDYYFIEFDPMMPTQESPDSFWVLRSSTYDWQSLPSPPDLGLNEAYTAFKSKTPSPNVGDFESVLFYSFDPFLGDGTWTIQGGADAFIESFSFITVQGRRRFHCPIKLPLPVFEDYSLHFSTSHIEKFDYFGEWENGYKATLYALLVNERGVRFVQPIEGCFEGIQPVFSVVCPALVYLRNNLDTIDMDYINSSAPQKVQNFLTVNVKSRHVYSIVDDFRTLLRRDDLYPFIDEIKEFSWMESKDPLFTESKMPKLF